MSVINATPLLAAAGGDYQISRSVRLRSSASAYFNRTPASAGNRKTWTLSGWVKRGTLSTNDTLFHVYGAVTTTTYFLFRFDSGGALYVGNSSTNFVITTQVFRDPSAWYHVVLSLDTTQTTATDRLKLYINGSQVTSFSSDNRSAQIALNSDQGINQASVHTIGRENSGALYLDGYLTEINLIDGQALTPSSFGETDSITGVWKPKKYAGTYGTNGFYLNFSDNSSNTATTIGKDNSGNGNNWTPNNISVTSGATYDSMIDVPTLYADGNSGRGNYAVMNPLHQAGTATPSFGNLRVTQATNNAQVASTFGMTTGKWYYEHTMTAIGGEQSVGIGLAPVNGFIVGGTTGQYGYYTNGNKYIQGTASAYGATYTNGDVIGVAYDADAGSLTFYKNGTSQGVATTGLSGTFFALAATRTAGGTNISDFNFGQRPFAYTPPTGFKALNTQNLPEPTIKKGNQYFDATTYTGNAGTNAITNSGAMQPDLVWMKSRSAADWHYLIDAVRGGSKILYSNTTSSEATDSTAVQSFNANGFTIGNNAPINTSGASYVGWQWKAGGTAVSNTAGSITSSVSANTTAGFSVVTYTGTGANATVGHGLGVAPAMVIVKNRNSSGYNWVVWHKSLPSGLYYLNLNLTSAQDSSATVWNSTVPSSTVFSIGTSPPMNTNGNTQVAYLFAEVAGFSKFGSYTGNGSADGAFVFTGFRPRWVLIKNASASEQWYLVDTARDLSNPSGLHLYPNLSNAEFSPASSFPIDILSNGFKVRTASAGWSTNGQTYIYACFAEHPFKNSLAR